MKRVLIHILTSPVLATEEYLEYQLYNISYGLSAETDIHYDLHFTFWNANPFTTILSINGSYVEQKLIDMNLGGMWQHNFKNLFLPECMEVDRKCSENANKCIKNFKNKTNLNYIKNITFDFNDDYKFRGYSAEVQFLIIDKFIRSIEESYDEYIFSSSNYEFLQRGMIDRFVKSTDKWPKLPMLHPHNKLDFGLNNNDDLTLEFRHCNLNFFMVRPKKYIKYFKEYETLFKLDEYFDSNMSKDLGVTTVGIHSNLTSPFVGMHYYKDKFKVYENHQNIYTTDELSKECYFQQGDHEPCISNFIAYMVDIYRNPEKYDLINVEYNLKELNKIVFIPNYFEEIIPWKIGRHSFHHQPFHTRTYYSRVLERTLNQSIAVDTTLEIELNNFIRYRLNQFKNNFYSDKLTPYNRKFVEEIDDFSIEECEKINEENNEVIREVIMDNLQDITNMIHK